VATYQSPKSELRDALSIYTYKVIPMGSHQPDSQSTLFYLIYISTKLSYSSGSYRRWWPVT